MVILCYFQDMGMVVENPAHREKIRETFWRIVSRLEKSLGRKYLGNRKTGLCFKNCPLGSTGNRILVWKKKWGGKHGSKGENLSRGE